MMKYRHNRQAWYRLQRAEREGLTVCEARQRLAQAELDCRPKTRVRCGASTFEGRSVGELQGLMDAAAAARRDRRHFRGQLAEVRYG
jgi:hypothetical protein